MTNDANPYQVPHGSSKKNSPEVAADKAAEQQAIVRRGVVPVLGVLWNLPLLVLLILMISGTLGEDRAEFLMVCWGGTVPFACMAAAYSPAVQRLLFVPDLDIQGIRSRLLGMAILWTVLTAIGIYFTWP